MTERMDLSQKERYDIVAYRIKCAEKTLGEIDDLLALRSPLLRICNPQQTPAGICNPE